MKRDLENNDKNTVLRYLCLTSEILEGNSKSFSITNERDSEQILLYSILMENITQYLIPACIKAVL